MGSEAEKSSTAAVVEVEGIAFPKEIAGAKQPLVLLAHGLTDIEIHFLQIKYTAIGVYLEHPATSHLLDQWKGKTAEELASDAGFYDAVLAAPVEKLVRVAVIKEIKGAQYGVQLESAVRDRLVALEQYDDAEEAALETLAGFFQSKYFRPNSVLTFRFPATPGPAEVSFVTEGKDEAKVTVDNENVAGMIQKWYLGGDTAVSPTTVRSLAEHFAALLVADQ